MIWVQIAQLIVLILIFGMLSAIHELQKKAQRKQDVLGEANVNTDAPSNIVDINAEKTDGAPNE